MNMTNKFSKLSSLYFLFTGITAAIASGFLIFTHGDTTQMSGGIFNRQLIVIAIFFTLLLVSSIFIFLSYFTWYKSSILLNSLENYLSKKIWARGVFLFSALIFLSGTLINLEPSLLPISFDRFQRIQPLLIWITFEAALTIFFLGVVISVQIRYSSAELFAFVINLIMLHSVQLFLFPLENYWITIATGIFVYIVFDALLVQSGQLLNFFLALDQEIVEIKEALWFIAAPILLAIMAMLVGQGKLIFLVPVFWLICSLQTFLTSKLMQVLDWNWVSKISFSFKHGILWTISIITVFVFYSLAFDSLKTYPRHNPLLEGDPVAQGVWYAIPVEKSDLFPLGYARLENSAIDDQGHFFFAVLGTTLGYVHSCDSPFPNTGNVLLPGLDSIQPIYPYSYSTLCTEWATTLPEFYWRIGLLGVLLISACFGIVILRDPLAFFAVAMILLRAWIFWPPTRPGHVEGLIFGMAFVLLLPYILGGTKNSTIVIGMLLYGIIAGVAGFMRNPSGLALLATGGIAIIVFVGIKKRQVLLSIITFFALIVGSRMIPTALNGLFWYRDARLQIIAPNTTLAKHGGGWNTLGGIGGIYAGEILYKNALDMSHWDAIIQLNIYNENPLSIFALTASTEEQLTSSKLLSRYIRLHPLEFFINVTRKAYRALNLIIDIPGNWMPVLYTVGIFGGVAFLLKSWFMRLSWPRIDNNTIHEADEALTLCLTLGIITAIPAILTDPVYFEATYPAAAVFFITILITLYYVIFYRVSSGK